MGVDRDEVGGVAAAAEARVDGWLAGLSAQLRETGAGRADERAGGSDLIGGVRRDADGFAFTRRLLEAVGEEGDPFAAALGFRAVSRQLPPSLPVKDRFAVRAGGLASLGLPWAVLPLARRHLRERVASLVLSARLPAEGVRESQLAEFRGALTRNAEARIGTVLALRGDGVVGPERAETEIRRLVALAEQPGVTHLAVDPARIIGGGGSAWSLDGDAQRAAVALGPVLAAAAAHEVTVILEPSSYLGALRAPEILMRALAPAEFDGARAGILLLAELPESRTIAERLLRWAKSRRADGGEAPEVVLGVRGIAGAEQIASILSGLAVPTLEGRSEQGAQLLRLADLVLGPAASGAVRPVVASEDPHLLAAAIEIAERHGAADQLTLQFRAGTADAVARLLAAEGHPVRLSLPLVPPREFASAVDPLIALAAEAADAGSALARLSELIEGAADPTDPLEDGRDGPHPARARADAAHAAEREVFRRALEFAAEPFPESHRLQVREREWDPSERDSALFYRPPAESERFDTGGLTAAVLGLTRGETGRMILEPAGPPVRVPVISESGFANEPETDASLAANREWVRRILHRAGEDSRAERESRSADPEAIADAALAAGAAWRAQRPADRATRVRRLALGTVAARDRLIEALAAETGAPTTVIDAEVNGAVDAARYLGQLATGLGAVRGAEFHPDRLAVVVTDAGVPLDERAEAVLAVLAAGSAVVWVTHPSVARSSTVLLEEWCAAGLPDGLVALLSASEADAARIAAEPRVDRAVVLGSRATAEALVRHRPDLRVSGRFRALGSVLVTPSADPISATRDAVRSAFGVGHGSGSATRAVVLLGSAARSRRLRGHLADAVRALRVGDSAHPGLQDPLIFDLGPLPEPPSEAGMRALTELDPGEEWVVEPEQLDDAGLLWSPGVRTGLRRGARFWSDAIGVPVIGVISARTLPEAISIQNDVGGGSIAALHATEANEILPWLEGVRAATLVIGRPTTGARIERLPGGGWGESGMGVQTLAGGPNRLVTLGSWQLREGTRSSTLHLRGLDPEVQVLIETAQASLDYPKFDLVRRAALSDALTWRTTLGGVHDTIGLGIERNLLRRWPVATHVRLAEGGEVAELIRVLAAAMVVGAPVTVSTGAVLPGEVSAFLAGQGIAVSLERDDAWLERIAISGPGGGAGGSGAEASGTGGSGNRDADPSDRVRLIGGDGPRAAEWMGGLARVELWAEPVTMAGPVELLAFVREQSISIAAHRHGLASSVAGIDEWIAELDDRVS